MTVRRMLGALAAVVLALLVLLALAWRFQRHLIYFPFPQPIPSASSLVPGAEEVTITTSDHLRLAAWFVPARGGRGVATMLVLHGNGGDRSLRAPLAESLAAHGLAVLLLDYRGYGGNAGTPGERGLMEDGRAARDYLASRPDVDPGRIVYFGESLGAAVAVSLALEHPPLALVLRSPFTSLADIGGHHYPYLPVRWLLRDRYPSIERIGRVGCPVLVVAGERDGIIPPSHSRRLFAAAREPKRFVLVPRADHNDYEMLAGDRLVEATVELVKQALAGAR